MYMLRMQLSVGANSGWNTSTRSDKVVSDGDAVPVERVPHFRDNRASNKSIVKVCRKRGALYIRLGRFACSSEGLGARVTGSPETVPECNGGKSEARPRIGRSGVVRAPAACSTLIAALKEN